MIGLSCQTCTPRNLDDKSHHQSTQPLSKYQNPGQRTNPKISSTIMEALANSFTLKQQSLGFHTIIAVAYLHGLGIAGTPASLPAQPTPSAILIPTDRTRAASLTPCSIQAAIQTVPSPVAFTASALPADASARTSLSSGRVRSFAGNRDSCGGDREKGSEEWEGMHLWEVFKLMLGRTVTTI